MKLSILIPVYNTERFLPELFDSISEQNIDDCEIIMLNDGSNDNSLNVCKEYEKRYPDTVKVISRTNKGAVRTRRELLAASEGEWIWIVDSDDYIDSKAISVLNDFLSDDSIDLIMFDCYRLTDKSESIIKQLDYAQTTVFDESNKEKLYLNLIKTTGLNPLWNKVFRRSCVDWDADYTEFEDVRRANDKLQSIPIINNAKKTVYIPQPLYHYRFVEGSLVNVYGDYTFLSVTKVNKQLEKYSRIWSAGAVMAAEMDECKRKIAAAHMIKFCSSKNPSYCEFKKFTDIILGDEFYLSAVTKQRFSLNRRKLPVWMLSKRLFFILYAYCKLYGVLRRVKGLNADLRRNKR